ncbi:MAG: PASTA domain-containing protein [Pyrinomonadaceae bacterium]|nr:PASTA domain-containing protein [Pyrinomonadaceae bacterium]
MATGALSALRRLSIVIAVAIVFVFGLGTTVYLSLRSPEVQVPDVLGKDRLEAERILGDADLNFRVRAFRPSNELKADTVLFQLPRPGEIVKAGQTVAMDLSRTVKEGESSESVTPEKTPENKADEKANQNTNEASANENKPKRKPTNKNANENANSANGNTNANANANSGNRNANANRTPSNRNVNTGKANTTTNASSNRPNTSSNRGANQNENRRPPVPKPSPVSRPNR